MPLQRRPATPLQPLRSCRQLHANPELSFEEVETSQLIRSAGGYVGESALAVRVERAAQSTLADMCQCTERS